jgi:RNA polymerase sigma-70 factor (ECF subfamily)
MTLVSFLDKTDQQGRLMLAFAGGDATAFDALYKHYRAPLYRFFLRQCLNQAIAEELYQELWMRVIKAKDSYTHTARFSTWLYHIAHNLVVDHFRKPEPDREEEEADSFTGSTAQEPETLAISEERVGRFLQLLEQLPDAQREVFLLKEEAGLSLEEIAHTTGSSFETVKSRLRYAVKKLRQSLEDAA